MTDDTTSPSPDECLRAFIETMAAAGNPGSGRHELGMHKVHGWILEYDPTIGGSQIQAVIGVDGLIHTRRAPRSERQRKLTASQWVSRETAGPDPAANAVAFVDHLARILAFDHAVTDGSDDE